MLQIFSNIQIYLFFCSLKPVPNVTQGNHIYLKAFHQPLANLCNFDKGILLGNIHLMTFKPIFS